MAAYTTVRKICRFASNRICLALFICGAFILMHCMVAMPLEMNTSQSWYQRGLRIMAVLRNVGYRIQVISRGIGFATLKEYFFVRCMLKILMHCFQQCIRYLSMRREIKSSCWPKIIVVSHCINNYCDTMLFQTSSSRHKLIVLTFTLLISVSYSCYFAITFTHNT